MADAAGTETSGTKTTGLAGVFKPADSRVKVKVKVKGAEGKYYLEVSEIPGPLPVAASVDPPLSLPAPCSRLDWIQHWQMLCSKRGAYQTSPQCRKLLSARGRFRNQTCNGDDTSARTTTGAQRVSTPHKRSWQTMGPSQ